MHPGEPGPLVRSMPGVPPGASPAAGPVVYSGLFSLAGAVGSATGLSLRSPRAVKIFSGTRATQPAAPAQSLSWPAEKHLARPGPAGCPPALLRLRAFRRRNTPQPRPRRRGPARRKARHEPHQLRRDHHLRQAGLRRDDHPRGLGLRGRLRPDLPRVRRGHLRAPTGLVGRCRAPVLIGGAHRPGPRAGDQPHRPER